MKVSKFDVLYDRSVLFGKTILSSVDGESKTSKIFIMFFVTHVLLLIVLTDFCYESCSDMNLGSFTEFAASSITFIRETLYMCILWRLKDKWNSLLDDMIAEKKSIKDSEQRKEMTEKYKLREFRTTMWFLIPSSVMIVMLATVSVFIYPNQYILPLSYNIAWLPYEGYSINWAVNYTYQMWNCLTCSLVYYTYYPLTLIMMNHSCWGIDLTLMYVHDLEQALKLDEKSPLTKSLVDEHLKNIIEMTYQVLQWRQRLQSALQFSFLVDFTLVSFIMCLCVFTLTSTEFDSFSVVTLPSTILLQLYVYCWMGNRVMTRFGKLTDAIYGINWYTMDISQQKDLQKIIGMTQNMQGFHGIFRTVSLSTFQKVILELTYTTYALLRNMKLTK